MNPISIALLLLAAGHNSPNVRANEAAPHAANTASSVVAAAETSSTEKPATAQKYGPTKQGETLAQVAQQVLTDATISNEQMMWALYGANPKAFENGNLNRLRAGAFLTVPTPEQARSVDAKIAQREIATRTARPAPKATAVKPSKTAELEAQIEEAKREQEEAAKEQVFLKARLKEMEDKIQALLRENAERDAKLRAQSAPHK
jgi:pilus assembly protein FimV